MSVFHKSSIYDCSVLQLPKVHNRAGNITSLHGNKDLPFDIKRIYYLYDVPGGETRGGHAHKNLYQLIVAASGSFDISLNDGVNQRTISLNRPYYGLLVVPGLWRELSNFSTGAILLVLASAEYDPQDYIRDFAEFTTLKHDSINIAKQQGNTQKESIAG